MVVLSRSNRLGPVIQYRVNLIRLLEMIFWNFLLIYCIAYVKLFKFLNKYSFSYMLLNIIEIIH